MADDPIDLTPELLDDFYAECDEQLTTIRTHLAQLAGGAAGPEVTAAALEAVFRSLHSFKGNAAIVGLAGAEGLAHAAETLLRRLTRREIQLDARLLHLLEQVAHRLENIVTAFREQQPLPPVEDLRGPLKAHELPSSAPVEPAGTDPLLEPNTAPGPALDAGASATPEGRSATAVFHPSPDLDQRGINVNTVRERLGQFGTIASATPAVLPGGKVSFRFAVVLSPEVGELPDWTDDGISWLETAGHPDHPAAGADGGTGAAPAAGGAHIVRVDLSRLDDLMRIAGEMVILRSRLQERLARVTGDTAGLQEVNHGLSRALRDLRTGIMRVRLVPVREIFSRIPFVVRDLTRDTDKKVRLVLEGQDTEVDKYIVERLREPLLHLVRNAISHGIESSGQRLAAGKPANATLRLRASTLGDAVQIQITDDGRGIDVERVAQRAREAGLAVPEPLDHANLLRLICTPGFSTRQAADRASGRGVGMAVVETALRELGGTVSLDSGLGEFTEFTLRLPLSLAIADTFIAQVGDHLCAIPQGQTQEVIQVDSAEIRTLNEAEVVPHRGALLPVLHLRRLFELESVPRPFTVLVVVTTDSGLLGLAVDRMVGQREVVVRPFRDALLRVPGFSGATELGDGRPVLILDPLTVRQAAAPAGARRAARPTLQTKAS